MWIFGYGSLIWKPGFRFEEKRPGFIHGWSRRFYQGSPDHRGVPEKPGRVVTLLEDRLARTGGMAFRVEGAEAEQVLRELDHREKGGYERHHVPIWGYNEAEAEIPVVESALVYVATEDNPHYLGPASPEAIALQVANCRGPSGPNSEYVLRLAQALKELNMVDEHVFAIAAALEELVAG